MGNRVSRSVVEQEQRAETFDPRRYWEERLRAHPDITGVGYLGRSPRFLELQYQARMCQVELALRRYGLTDLAQSAVLDVGSGTGIWLDFWHKHGAGQVVGLDFAQPSVDRLKRQFPDDLIAQADLTAVPLALPDTVCFDIISAFDVLLHIVDANGLRRAIANLADRCVIGGWLILSDPIVQGRRYVPTRTYAVHNKVRLLAEYREILEARGFIIDSVRPATILLGNPLEAANRLAYLTLLASWKATGLWGRSSFLADLLGPAAFKADSMACRLSSGESAPGAKLIFARKIS